MNKIQWSEKDLVKENFPVFVHSAIICEHCGWLLSISKYEQNFEKNIDNENCINCGKNYKDTRSKIFRLFKGKNAK